MSLFCNVPGIYPPLPEISSIDFSTLREEVCVKLTVSLGYAEYNVT